MNKFRKYLNLLPLNEVYAHPSKWQQFKYRIGSFLIGRTLKWSLLIGSIASMTYAGIVLLNAIKPTVVFAEKEVVVDFIPPVLRRIAQAESGNSHYCTKVSVAQKRCRKASEGQVLVNDTKDVGKYQINLDINGKFCTDLGLNVFNEQDNEKCALQLFYQRGTEPWSASKPNWNK